MTLLSRKLFFDPNSPLGTLIGFEIWITLAMLAGSRAIRDIACNSIN
jgi:hypothetical protein